MRIVRIGVSPLFQRQAPLSRITAAISLLFVAVLAGCDSKPGTPSSGGASSAPSAAVKSESVIGVSLLRLSDPFFIDMADAMKARAAELGYRVEVVSGEVDPARQRNQVEDFVTKRVAAIILCPVDSKAIGTSIARANEAGIPVFTADIAVVADGAKIVSHIATDNFAGGKLAAEAMFEAIGGVGPIAIVDHPEVESVIMRTRGFEERLAELNREKGASVEVVKKLPCLGARDKAFQVAEAILQAHADLKGIWAINDQSALGVVAALEKANLVGKVKVVGFDGQPEALEAMKAGKMSGDVVQHPREIGKKAIEAVSDYGRGKDVPAQTLIPPTLVKP